MLEYPTRHSLDLSLTQFHNERFPIEVGTQVVDFRISPELKDPHTADACVRVLTSDGVIGTISHLTVFHNPEAFVSELARLLGKSGVPVILNGGQDWLPSKALRDRLSNALVVAGFKLSGLPAHEDTLGSFSRDAVITADRVLVTRKPYGESPPEELTLYFPFPVKDVYFIDDKEKEDFIMIVGNLLREGAHRIIVHGSSLREKNHGDVDVYAEYSQENALKAGVDVGFGTSIYRIEGGRSRRVFDIRRTIVPFELSDVGSEGKLKIVLFEGV